MTQFSALQDEVLAHQFADSKYRPYVKVWINEGQKYICLQADIRTEITSQSYATVNGTATLSLPSNYARCVDLSNTDDQRVLEQMDLRDYDDAVIASGSPVFWVVVGSNVTLYPTPDNAYNLRLRYWKLPTDLSGDTDTPEIPSQYHHLLIRYALIRCYQRENDYQAAEYQRTEFERDLQKLRGEVHSADRQGPVQVRGTWGEFGRYDPNTWY